MKNINIEVVQYRDSYVSSDRIQRECEEYFKETGITPGRTLTNIKTNQFLMKNVYCIIIDESTEMTPNICCENVEWNISWYIYRLDNMGAQEEVIEGVGGEESMILSTNWLLPSEDFHGLWENLIYETSIKQNLLCYVETTLLFSTKLVDQRVISSNRVVLLHGPPGTGKTSLCRALAHKLAIRLAKHYDSAQLIEVNSHSLMSKWFSESGKLVTKMFSHIRDLSNDSQSLIVVLIDEVESLAHARSQAMSGSEPSDSLRVVNAVLTQLDHLRRYPNVLILTTSNLTGAIDLAFVDRADIKQYIGLPTVNAIYQVYYSCIQELLRAGIIKPHDVIFPLNYFKGELHHNESLELLKISQLSIGLSGRTLRKMPFLAHALFLRTETVTLLEFLQALSLAVEKNRADTKQIQQSCDLK